MAIGRIVVSGTSALSLIESLTTLSFNIMALVNLLPFVTSAPSRRSVPGALATYYM